MTTIVLTIDPEQLSNPDLDIRYRLPDLLIQESGGLIQDNGYDYSEDNKMLLFLSTVDENREAVLSCVQQVIKKVRVLENDLSKAVTITVEESEESKI